MNTVTTTVANSVKTEEGTYEDIVRYVHFSANLISSLVYGIEKVKRMPEIIAESIMLDSLLDDVGVVEKAKVPLDTVAMIVGGVSSVLNFVKFMTKVYPYLHDKEIPVIGIKLKNVPVWIKVTSTTLLILMLLRIALRIHGKHSDKVTSLLMKKDKHWKKPISLLMKGGSFVFGVYQLVMLVKEPETFKQQKLFVTCSILDNLTAPLDMVGIDSLLYRSDAYEGIVYASVYGLKTAVKSGQTVGILTAES